MAAPRREDSATVTHPEGLGPYWLLERMAEGRLGPVHRACLRREGKPDTLFVLKRISVSIAAEPGFSERFNALMSEVANVVHPALCAIEDVGSGPEGELYVAVEHVIGRDLGRIHAALAHRGQALPPALVVYVANQVADALAAAHRATRGARPAPLFHGELALSEILVGYDGSVRLTGLGSHALETLVPGLAPRGNRAPELERDGRCDARSDVYSLGACMYELLTGGPALPGSKFSAEAPLPRPQSHIARVVPRALQPIVSRALADDPRERFQSATDLGRALRRWSQEQSTPGDAAALAAFLHAQLDAERSTDEARLRSALAGLHPDRQEDSASRERVIVDGSTRVRARTVVPPNATPPSGRLSTPQNFDDLAEQTPARGHLMNELAATMSGAPAPRLERSATRGALEADPVASDWGEHTPVHGWVSASEEDDAAARKAVSESRRAAAAIRTPVVPRPTATPVAPAPAAQPRAARRQQLPAWLIVGLAAGVAAAAIAAFSLLRGEPSAQLSTLQVQTHPAGAEVFLQGERIGTTPLRRDNIASGKLTLELRKQGFEKLTRAITLAPAQVFQLDIDLTSRRVEEHSTPIAAAPPASAETPDARDEEASEPRPSRQGTPSRSESRRRRSGDADEAPSQQPSAAAAATSDDEAEGAAGTAQGASAGATAAARIETAASAQPAAGSAGEPADRPEAGVGAASKPPSKALSKPASSVRAATPAVSAQPRGPSRGAVAIDQVSPRFPARARRAGITSGAVTLEYTVDNAGAVRNPRVVSANPPGVFDDVALRAIEKWRYQPKLDAGRPVESRLRFTFRFAE